MFRLETNSLDLAASRFVISPLHESLECLYLLSGGYHDAVLSPWFTRHHARFEQLRSNVPAVDALTVLVNTDGYSPDFLSPPPSGIDTTAAGQIEVVRATPSWQADNELRIAAAERKQPVTFLDEMNVVGQLANGLQAVWDELLKPEWLVIRAILQQDLQYRAELLLTQGWDGALAGLSPKLSWRVGAFEADRQGDEHYPVGGGGLLFAPSIFGLTTLTLQPPWQRTIHYPARGRAHLMPESQPAPAAAMTRLIGQTRARVLGDLDQPATTTQLATLHRLSPGTVGHHLSALRDSGLLVGTRTGKEVFYRRTALGDALVNANALK